MENVQRWGMGAYHALDYLNDLSVWGLVQTSSVAGSQPR